MRVNAILPGNIMTNSRITAVAASKDPQRLHNWLEERAMAGAKWDHGGSRPSVLYAGQRCEFITGIGLILSGGAEARLWTQGSIRLLRRGPNPTEPCSAPRGQSLASSVRLDELKEDE